MSEIISQAQRSATIVANTSMEPWERVWQGLKALSGIAISNLSKSAREIVESELAQVNRITSDYDLEVSDDYEAIGDADITEALQRIGTVTNALIDSEVERVMTGLREATGKIPRVEIAEVRQHKELFVPLLIEAIEQAIASVRAGNEPDGEAHFFAAFLLTELEVDAAFPILVEGFTLPGEGGFDLFGDAVHSLLPSALALFSRDGTDTIDEIVRDTGIDLYVRWAASTAYIQLVRDGKITRDTAVARLHEQLVQIMPSREYELIAAIICLLADLAAEEALETIKEAFEQGLVETSIADLESVESDIAAGKDTIQRSLENCRPTGMPDTIAELSCWASFREVPFRPLKKPTAPNPVPELKSVRRDSARAEPVASVPSGRVRVGRNEPCPCGSGKKFKKCCR